MAGFSVPVFTWYYQGQLASGGSVYVYKTGTTTLQTIYSDGGLTTPISNPQTLDANGQCKFYVSGLTNLRLDGYTVGGMATGTLIESIDPVFPTSIASSSGAIGTVVYEGSNFTLSTSNLGNNLISTAPITIALPQTTTFTNSYSVQLNAQGGAITLSPFASDKIQSGSAGANFVMPAGSSAELWTDAVGNWGLNFYTGIIPTVSVTQASTDNSTKIATTAFVKSVAGFYNGITGCLPSSITGTSTTASVAISAGQAADSTNVMVINWPGFTWSVTNGNAVNGYQGGSTLPNSSTIHFYIMTNTAGVAGTFASTSLTPTLPSGFTFYRRVFSLNTNSSGALLPGTAIEIEGGGLLFWLTTQLKDLNGVTPATAGTLYTLTVPTGIKVEVKYRAAYQGSGGTNETAILLSGDETSIAPTGTAAFGVQATSAPSVGFTTVPGFDISIGGGTDAGSSASGFTEINVRSDGMITTNTSGQILIRSSAATNVVYLITRGFKDFRRV